VICVPLFRRPIILLVITFFAFLVGIALLVYLPPNGWFKYTQKPEPMHEYYYIHAEEDGRELMRVPIAVSIDDELITEDNKRYRIIRVEGNVGVARFMESIDLDDPQSLSDPLK
jgi:hypothetical protein